MCSVPQIRSLGELPFSLSDDVLKYKTTHNIDQLTELNFKEDHYTTSILNTLGSAKAFGISPSGEETNEESLVQGIAVSDIDLDGFSIQPSTIIIPAKFLSCSFNVLVEE